ncbi:MAG TPA: hypothetical protein VGX28_03875 [Frankiaceae bacterium]|jgi:hypothetical protein|nr:hypothetical protein [Frankiaceae bacterium]
MTRRLLAAVLLLGATAVPAYADHDRFLTVTGDGSGYVDVTFDTEVTLDTLYTQYRTSGRVSGIYVHKTGASLADDVIAIQEHGFGVVRSGPYEPLPAGKYRVYLVADGRATVRVLARGLRHNVAARVTRRTRVPVSAERMDVRADSPVRYRGDTRTPLRGHGSMVLAAYRTTLPKREVPATWGGVEICVEQPGEQPCDDTTAGLVPTGRTGSTSAYGSSRFTTARDGAGGVLRQRYAGTAEPTEVWTMTVEIPL